MDSPIAAIDLNFFDVGDFNTPQTIGGIFSFAGIIPISLIQARINSLITIFPRLTQLPDLKRSCWIEDKNFELKKQLTVHREILPTELLGKLQTKELPFNQPLWRLDINYCEQEQTTQLIFTFHHSFTDGIGALAFTFSLFSPDQASSMTDSPQLTKIFSRLPKQSARLKFIPQVKRVALEVFANKDRSQLTGQNSAERRLHIFDISLSSLKTERLQLRCGSNDMILAALANSLQNFLRQKNSAAQSVRAIIPFNLRLRHEVANFSNHLAGVSVEIPFGDRTITEQARSISAQQTAVKFSGEYGAYSVLAAINASLPRTLRKKVAHHAARTTAFICTNMPGPREEQYLGGARLLGCYGSPALMPGQGLGFSFISMRDKVCCSLITDPAIIENEVTIVNQFCSIFKD